MHTNDTNNTNIFVKINKNNFWEKLEKPFFVLAPLADVTDAAFRELIAKYSRHGKDGGGPDVFFTEFVSADGLAHEKGKEKLLIDLGYSKNEHPIVAQVFGANPENIREASKLVRELGFDGVDINMGCPDRSVEKQGAGAALIKNPKLAQEIIKAAQDGSNGLPVSVKTRIGYNTNQVSEWIPALLECGLSALTIHARTRKEMSKVPAHWEYVKRAVNIRNEMKSKTLIIGNGDVVDIADARKKAEESGVDGVMLGRAIFGNPWLFSNLAHTKCDCQIENPPPILPQTNAPKFDKKRKIVSLAAQNRNRPNPPAGGECAACKKFCKIGGGHTPTVEEKLCVMVEHTKLFEEKLASKNFAVMKKHYKAYVTGFDGAKELRMILMGAENASQVENIVKNFLCGILKSS